MAARHILLVSFHDMTALCDFTIYAIVVMREVAKVDFCAVEDEDVRAERSRRGAPPTVVKLYPIEAGRS